MSMIPEKPTPAHCTASAYYKMGHSGSVSWRNSDEQLASGLEFSSPDSVLSSSNLTCFSNLMPPTRSPGPSPSYGWTRAVTMSSLGLKPESNGPPSHPDSESENVEGAELARPSPITRMIQVLSPSRSRTHTQTRTKYVVAVNGVTSDPPGATTRTQASS